MQTQLFPDTRAIRGTKGPFVPLILAADISGTPRALLDAKGNAHYSEE